MQSDIISTKEKLQEIEKYPAIIIAFLNSSLKSIITEKMDVLIIL